MTHSHDFEIDCPNNHNQTVTLSRDSFEDSLKSGSFEFHCNTCDTDWVPTKEQLAIIRKQFSKDAD